MTIQRYKIVGTLGPTCEVEDSDGYFVLHTDHLREVEKLRTTLSRFDNCPSKELLLDAGNQLCTDEYGNLSSVEMWLQQVAKGGVGDGGTETKGPPPLREAHCDSCQNCKYRRRLTHCENDICQKHIGRYATACFVCDDYERSEP